MRIRCCIVEVASGRLTPALVRPVQQSDKVLWSRWHPHMPFDAEDGHWDWDAFIDEAIGWPDAFAGYALEADGELQGLRHLGIDPNDNEVIVHGTHAMLLATAPWNRPPNPRYRGVGSVLVCVAILQSIRDGHDGRVHCESLPGAEVFHRSNGMVEFGTPRFGMKRFRFSGNAARAFLQATVAAGLLAVRGTP